MPKERTRDEPVYQVATSPRGSWREIVAGFRREDRGGLRREDRGGLSPRGSWRAFAARIVAGLPLRREDRGGLSPRGSWRAFAARIVAGFRRADRGGLSPRGSWRAFAARIVAGLPLRREDRGGGDSPKAEGRQEISIVDRRRRTGSRQTPFRGSNLPMRIDVCTARVVCVDAVDSSR
jgi:hypothetical protein